MRPYQVLITREIVTIIRPTAAVRQRIYKFLDLLSHEPQTTGDYQERDSAGRTVQVKIIGGYALTYWADHAVEEVKVTHIERAD